MLLLRNKIPEMSVMGTAASREETKNILSSYLPFWDSITDSQRERFLASATRRKYGAGATVGGAAGECTGLIIVLSGQLRVYTVTSDGREITVYRLFGRDMCLFSGACVISGIRFSVLVEAAEDTDTVSIPADVYKSVMEVSAPVANFTNELMASHFSEVMWLIDRIIGSRLDARLAALLLEERALRGSDTLCITHEMLGNHLGTAREVVSRMLSYFRSEGLVTLGRGTVTLADTEGLTRIAGTALGKKH